MAIDALQLKLKKCGSAIMLDLTVLPEELPACLMEECGNIWDAYNEFCRRLLKGLKGELAAVRFRLLHFAILGERGNVLLSELLKYAASLGYYTVLDVPGLLMAEEAAFCAQTVWGDSAFLPCDGVVISGFPGSDVVKPFLLYCREKKKDLFIIVRSPNKSAGELQDLISGPRTVYMAAADYVNRHGADTVGKYGYSRVGITVSAAAGDSVRILRSKYPKLFMIVDGVEIVGANAKNCSYAFDKMGYGALVSVGRSVTCAWKDANLESTEFEAAAKDAVQKHQNRIGRYVKIL